MSPQTAARNVLVVIGTGGMGLAVARRLGGGRRILLADWSAPGLEAAVATLCGEGHQAEGHIVDVSRWDSVEKLADAAGAAAAHSASQVDAVVHTAGVSPVTATARQIYEVDLLGTAHVIDAFLAVAAVGTSLVCVASMTGHFASLAADFERHLATAPTGELLGHKELDPDADPRLAYVVAKRGNHLRVQAAAHGWGAKGARLNTISPGVISTPMGAQELQGPAGAHIQAMIDLSGARRAGTRTTS
ncbi:SDR family oxidoreductase [Streptomyces sp. NPDC093544]|uniref:SDR family oxidoreductase n=1 Tax=Streptomyces sp. NPDC093544 TaxID=3155200 RepID=UPI003414FF06